MARSILPPHVTSPHTESAARLLGKKPVPGRRPETRELAWTTHIHVALACFCYISPLLLLCLRFWPHGRTARCSHETSRNSAFPEAKGLLRCAESLEGFQFASLLYILYRSTIVFDENLSSSPWPLSPLHGLDDQLLMSQFEGSLPRRHDIQRLARPDRSRPELCRLDSISRLSPPTCPLVFLLLHVHPQGALQHVCLVCSTNCGKGPYSLVEISCASQPATLDRVLGIVSPCSADGTLHDQHDSMLVRFGFLTLPHCIVHRSKANDQRRAENGEFIVA